MAEDKLMMQSLSALLEEGETLKHPVYGSLRQARKSWFGYFGLTDSHLLISLLEGNTQKVFWTTRILLDVKEVTVQKRKLLSQLDVRIEFNDGMHCSIHLAEKVYGIKGQTENLENFLQTLQDHQAPD